MMQSALPMRSAWFGTAAFLTLAALTVFAPTSAEAGCKSHRATLTGRPAFAGLSELWDVGAASDPATPVPVDAPAPCTGAFCSGSPAVPVAPVVAPIVGHGQWAILVVRPDARELSSEPLPYDESEFLPSHCGLSVFHPPRSVDSASV
jgi:hypothetical protein